MELFNYNKFNSEKNIIDDILNLPNNNYIISIYNNNINFIKILNMLPKQFDDYADLSNNKILILYNTLKYKILYKYVDELFILILFNSYELLIYVCNDCFIELLTIIKYLYKKKIKINKISYLGIYNKKINLLLSKLCNNIVLENTNLRRN